MHLAPDQRSPQEEPPAATSQASERAPEVGVRMARPAMCSGDGALSGHPLAYLTGAENRSGQIPGREHTSERDQGVDQTDGDADLAAAVRVTIHQAGLPA